MIIKRANLLFQTLNLRMILQKQGTVLANTCFPHLCSGANYSTRWHRVVGGLNEIIHVKNDKYSGSVSCYY